MDTAAAAKKDLEANRQMEETASETSSEQLQPYRKTNRRMEYVYISVAVVLGAALIAVLVYFTVTNALKNDPESVSSMDSMTTTEDPNDQINYDDLFGNNGNDQGNGNDNGNGNDLGNGDTTDPTDNGGRPSTLPPANQLTRGGSPMGGMERFMRGMPEPGGSANQPAPASTGQDNQHTEPEPTGPEEKTATNPAPTESTQTTAPVPTTPAPTVPAPTEPAPTERDAGSEDNVPQERSFNPALLLRRVDPEERRRETPSTDSGAANGANVDENDPEGGDDETVPVVPDPSVDENHPEPPSTTTIPAPTLATDDGVTPDASTTGDGLNIVNEMLPGEDNGGLAE